MKKIKSITLIVLSMIFMILLVAPVSSPQIALKGWWVDGQYGPTCICPVPIFWTCICYLII